jgi:nucleotide-binding universal stress UspA family protein
MSTMIIGTDFSDNSLNALKVAFNLAEKLSWLPVIVHVERQLVDVAPSTFVASVDHIDDLNADFIGQDLYQSIQTKLTPMLNSQYKLEIYRGVAADGINNACDKYKAELIVTGLKGHSIFENIFIGSVAQRIFELAKVPVFGVHEDLKTLPQKALYCCDFLSSGSKAYDWTKKLLEICSFQLDLMHIVTPTSVLEIKDNKNNINSLAEALEEAEALAKENIEKLIKSLNGEVKPFVQQNAIIPVGEEIIAHIEEHQNDLAILGSHGHTGVKKWLMGSTSDYIIKRAKTSVLVCR